MGRVVLVQVGRPGRLARGELLRKVDDDASRSMWGSSCVDEEALRRECFTCQRCGQTGEATRDRVRLHAATVSVVLVDGDRFVGILMGSMEGGALFVYNVCVHHTKRGKGFAAQLFAWLAHVYRGPVALDVYAPVRPLFRGGRKSFEEASRRFRVLLAMYAKYGFEVVGVEGDMVRMRARALVRVPPLSGALM